MPNTADGCQQLIVMWCLDDDGDKKFMGEGGVSKKYSKDFDYEDAAFILARLEKERYRLRVQVRWPGESEETGNDGRMIWGSMACINMMRLDGQ